MTRALCLALTTAVLAPACQKKKEPPPPVIRPVRYVTVAGDDGASSRRFSGVAQAGEESRLSSRVPGTLEELAVKLGDRVKKGALIARLDARDLELQVSEATAALGQARAGERNAQASYRRVRALYENQNASRQDLDNARAAAESATMQMRSISQRIALARRQVEHASVTAPADGVISGIFVEQNENVSPGQPIASLQSGDELEVRVSLPESLITRVERDQAVSVEFDAIKGTAFAGRVFEVGVSSERTATFTITVRLEEPSEAIRAGMAADVTIEFAAGDDAARHRLPSVAVGEDMDGRFVFVVTPTHSGFGTVTRRPVKIGKLTGEGLEILEGVEDGERVVTAGVSHIRDGLRVRVPPARDAAQ